MNFTNPVYNPNIITSQMNNPNTIAPQMNNQMMQQIIFNPFNLQQQQKRILANQAIAATKIHSYKMLPKYKSIKYEYFSTDKFHLSQLMNLCEVEVVNEHILDAVEQYALKGIEILINKPQLFNSSLLPVVVNVVSRDFKGMNLEKCEDMRDDIVLLRTTYCNTISNETKYPLKDNECMYSLLVSVIRNKNPLVNPTFLQFNDIYSMSVITVSPIKTETTLDEDKMLVQDYLNTLTTIETIFQTAIHRNHQILILPPFGLYLDKNPIDDVIKIINLCIIKYCSAFKKIIIAIPPFYPKTVFDNFNQNIIRLQDIYDDVDTKWENEDMKNSLMSNPLMMNPNGMMNQNEQMFNSNSNDDNIELENIVKMIKRDKKKKKKKY